MSLWNYCTLSKAALIMFAFDLYDNDNSGEIDIGEVELLLKEVRHGARFVDCIQYEIRSRGSRIQTIRDVTVWTEGTRTQSERLLSIPEFSQPTQNRLTCVPSGVTSSQVYGREFQASSQAQAIMTKLKSPDNDMERDISVDRFREFCRTHPAVLYPAFVLQTQMQEKILGPKFWTSCGNDRVKLSDGKYIDIADILQAHINEKARHHDLPHTVPFFRVHYLLSKYVTFFQILYLSSGYGTFFVA